MIIIPKQNSILQSFMFFDIHNYNYDLLNCFFIVNVSNAKTNEWICVLPTLDTIKYGANPDRDLYSEGWVRI